MNKKYVLVIDQGSTSTRVVLIDKKGDIKYTEQMEFTTNYYSDGGVYFNPKEIYETITLLIDAILTKNSINPNVIDSIGITNQRESTILWNKHTNEIIYKAISWQATITDDICKDLIDKGYEPLIKERTGLPINSYFSATKIMYLLEKTKLPKADLMFGTMDTYLLYNLTNKKEYKTDITNASRTLLFNIDKHSWDEDIIKLLKLEGLNLPEVCDNDTLFGHYNYKNVDIPIRCLIGDQQSSLFGQICIEEGNTKCTYGTGCFILRNTKDKKIISNSGLITTIAYKINGKVSYALEGSIFVGGSSLKWLRDNLGLFEDVSKTENLANKSMDEDLIIVPAFYGLGAPYWDSDVKGTMFGIKASTSKDDIVKATLKSIAFQVKDVLSIMNKECKTNELKFLSVDGGASNNNYLMQFQSDLLEAKIYKTSNVESTALGAGYISGLSSGFYSGIEELKNNNSYKRIYLPNNLEFSRKQYKKWLLAIKATKIYKI